MATVFVSSIMRTIRALIEPDAARRAAILRSEESAMSSAVTVPAQQGEQAEHGVGVVGRVLREAGDEPRQVPRVESRWSVTAPRRGCVHPIHAGTGGEAELADGLRKPRVV